MTDCDGCMQAKRLKIVDEGFFCPYSGLKTDENKKSVCPVKMDMKLTVMWNSLSD